MDLRAVVTLSTLLFVTADQTLQPVNVTSTSTQTSSISRNFTSSSTAPTATAVHTAIHRSSEHPLGLLTIRWIKCVGSVNMILLPSSLSLPVCSNSSIKSHLKIVCENQIGCKGTPSLVKNGGKHKSYLISVGGGAKETYCETLRVQCTVENPECEDSQLQAYKVVTGLLCCVLLVLCLMRFTRPTIQALQRRLSDRRQNRWIGPTQSHSVSYNRGKTVVKNNDGEKRLSYPALERLAVSESREPSSNRNSDYNF